MLLRSIVGPLHALWDVLYPHNCICCGCGTGAGPFDYLCDRCRGELYWVNSPRCPTCGTPFYGIVESPPRCPNCIELKPVFRSGHTLFLLRGAGKQLVHELKYRHGLYLLKDLQTLMEQRTELSAFLKNAVLVPVPLHPKRKRQRGFNQSYALARCLAKISEGTAIETLLRRVVYTPTQTRLNRQERQRNLRNAFSLKKGCSIQSGRKYIVVDDVLTTGSTLNACCKTLRKTGIDDLHIFALGHG